MHLRTARAECGRNSFKKRENIIEDHENLNLTVMVENKQSRSLPNAHPRRRVTMSNCQHDLHAVIAFYLCFLRVSESFTSFFIIVN